MGLVGTDKKNVIIYVEYTKLGSSGIKLFKKIMLVFIQMYVCAMRMILLQVENINYPGTYLEINNGCCGGGGGPKNSPNMCVIV